MEKFQVDLHGIVEVLSRHLYSSPRVFVRELLQNGIDALTARRALHPDHQGRITVAIRPDGSTVFTDDGIGLTAPEVRDLLATIGRTSKRDELDLQREGYLGQFGIGLLSCFLVSDTIEVRTRSAREVDAETLLWVARGDGTYQLTQAEEPLPEPGTTVTLTPRAGEQWLKPAMVKELAAHYGALLPVPITVSDNGLLTQVAPRPAPWELSAEDAAAYCSQTFGFAPMATIPLRIPVAGITGVAFVLPTSANPGQPSKNRVYLRRMLLGEAVPGLLPDWASFVRVVVDVENLRPTASRETLYDDELLAAARKELGNQLRGWLRTTNEADPPLLRRFVDVHRLSVCAAALNDDDVLAIAREWLPWPTTTGTATIAELRRSSSVLHFTSSPKTYDGLQAVAAARGTTVINASHVYATELLRRFASADPGMSVQAVGLSDLIDEDAELDGVQQRVVRAGASALADVECEVAMRPYDPAGTPALYVIDQQRADRARADRRRASVEADPLLAGLLDPPDESEDDGYYEPMGTLVLNTRNDLVGLLQTLDDARIGDVVRALYFIALQSGGASVSDHERTALTQALISLIARPIR